MQPDFLSAEWLLAPTPVRQVGDSLTLRTSQSSSSLRIVCTLRGALDTKQVCRKRTATVNVCCRPLLLPRPRDRPVLLTPRDRPELRRPQDRLVPAPAVPRARLTVSWQRTLQVSIFCQVFADFVEASAYRHRCRRRDCDTG